jgi:hypothetical protein
MGSPTLQTLQETILASALFDLRWRFQTPGGRESSGVTDSHSEV